MKTRHQSLALAAILLASSTFLRAQSEGLPPFPDMDAFGVRLQEIADVPAANPVEIEAPAAESSMPVLPSTFTIHERFFAWTNTFDIKSGKKPLGTITEKFWSMTKSFTYTDPHKSRLAEAKARFFALGSTVDVTDGGGQKIGTIKEDIFKSFFKVYTLYKILDASGREIATSEKTEWLSTEIVLRDPTGRVVAEVRRGFKENLLRLTDRWDVKIYDQSAIDSRLVVMIAAYKSSVDNDRRREEARKKRNDGDDD